MEQKHLEMVSTLNAKLGANGQLLNLNKECAEMQVIVSDMLRGFDVPRSVFVGGLADLYVMLNAVVLLYHVTPAEINALIDGKLSRSLEFLSGPVPASETEPSGVVLDN